MINITIWYEYAQECEEIREDLLRTPHMTDNDWENFRTFLTESGKEIHKVYPAGLSGTLAAALRKHPGFHVTESNLYQEEFGLSEELLEHTDVLIYWAHVAHDAIPDGIAGRIVRRVQAGMGFIPLHSAHKSKPFMYLLGTSGCLSWREGDFCRVWNISPAHPIAAGIPDYFELPEEEMYGEPFDVPKPEETIFISWYGGGEVFRSGLTWTRGYGRIFYFQCGHETSPSYHDQNVLRIIENAVLWAAPRSIRKDFDCPNKLISPETARKK